MVVGEAEHVKTGGTVVVGIAARRPEKVASLWIAAFLARFATVDEHTFEVAERDIGRPEPGRYAGEEAYAVVVGQVVLGVIGTKHHVADRGNADPGAAADRLDDLDRFGDGRGFRRRLRFRGR